MGRSRRQTKVQAPPRVKGFIPVGYYGKETGKIQLNVEEYECIRLLDYEGLSQVEAAQVMEVSRPTLTRIYERARKKVATAFAEAKELVIEGGTAIYEGNWFHCESCKSNFNLPLESENMNKCSLCGSDSVVSLSGGGEL